ERYETRRHQCRTREARHWCTGDGAGAWRNGSLDVYFVSPTPAKRHARVGGHPVPMALVPWIPAFAGMTRGPKYWQCIYEMDIYCSRLPLTTTFLHPSATH